MFKFIFTAAVCAAMCLPTVSTAQDCGCEPAPTSCCEPAPAPCGPKTRKKLQLVDVQKQVCRLKRVCVTDECGCTKSKFVRVKECVTRKKLTVVETPVDPCRQGLFQRLRGKLGSAGCCKPEPSCGCDAPAPAPCGCEAAAPAPCSSCGTAVPAMAAPMDMSAPMVEPTPMIEAAPMVEAPATN